MNILVWLAVPAAILAAAALVVWKLLRSRNMEIWLGSYLRRPRVPASAGGRSAPPASGRSITSWGHGSRFR